MYFDEDNIKAKMDDVFTSRNVTGDIAELAAALCARFLYLNQVMSVNTLMESSFTRCKNLNSAITLAANHFYSVPRGKNVRLRISNVIPIRNIKVKQFDVISTYGQYKMCYAQDYDLRSGFVTVIEVFLALDSKIYEFRGNNRLVQVTPLNNVSQDYYIMSNEPYTDPETDTILPYTVLPTTEQLSDMIDDDSGKLVGVITDINFSVRLWKQSGFSDTLTYTIRYLSSPDTNIPMIDYETEITQIPGFTISVSTKIELLVQQEQQLRDKELIYLFATNKIKSKDVLKTFNGFEQRVKEFFPEFLGFNVIIGVSATDPANPTVITIYYQVSIDPFPGTLPPPELATKMEKFKALAKAFYVPNTITFTQAMPVNIYDFNMTVVVDNEISYDKLLSVVSGYQNKIGVLWNGYQLMADITRDEELRKSIVRVDIPTEFLLASDQTGSAIPQQGTPVEGSYYRFAVNNPGDPVIKIKYQVV